MSFDERTRILLGDAGAERLMAATICVFGLGGVGAAAAMDLVRVGVGNLVVVDFDEVQESNLNRLYFGYHDSIGRAKTDVFIEAALQINPGIHIQKLDSLVRGADAARSIPEGCDYYLDCIDTLNPKVNLIAELLRRGLPFATSMGTAGRLAPERLRAGSLWDSAGCPLAQKVRQRLRRLGYGQPLDEAILCVWSDEPPVAPALPADGSLPGQVVNGERVRAVQGSAPFVPQAAGHLLASLAVRAILSWK
ncbi:MAG: ThiF family adenylyltransferase [Clostridia bacterium]|jgi:tRNA A37 threonylcarbamoyladenosine dehydratase